MRPKLLAVLAIATAGAMAVAACGGGDSQAPTLQPTRTPTAAKTAAVPSGSTLASDMGCTACHSVAGNVSVGPTWKGLFGKMETLTDGSTAMVDEVYLRESILTPNAKIVQGFSPGIMTQNFREQLTDTEVQAIIDYIKTLQ